MLSHREAARAWGVSRATIQRAVKAGKLSLTPEKTIDPAEMVRVFGEPPSRLASRPMEPLEARGEPGVSHPNTSRLTIVETENAALKAELSGLRETLSAKDANLADLRAEVLRLTHDRPPEPAPTSRRRWWRKG